jgi:TonB-linked SusC/RagA family outer membrane protein
MKSSLKILLLIMLLITSTSAIFAQITVTGKVIGTDNKPIPGANVIIRGTTVGALTDVDGKFMIQVPSSTSILTVSFIGYVRKEVEVGKNTVFDITLETESTALDEVVVIGYGTQKKINLTGSVDAISSKELENLPLPNMGEVLRGISPNLNIQIGDNGGEPGATLKWNIRGMGSINGNTSPLILVDGVEININNINPENIESVSVLKDASACAIYGSRAPFGVVLITTKKGTKGATRVQYSNNIIASSPLGIAHMYNSSIFATAYNQASVNAGSPPLFNDTALGEMEGWLAGTFKTDYDPNNVTTSIWNGRQKGVASWDWPHIMFKNWKIDQQHNIDVSGGTDKSLYYISLGYFDQNGFYSAGNDGYKRYDFISNFSSQITKWLKFNFSSKLAKTGTDYGLGITTVERGYFLTNLYAFGPNVPRYNINGTLANPMYINMANSGRDKTVSNDILVSVGTEIEPIKGWKTNISYNYNSLGTRGEVNPHPVPVELGNGKFGNSGKPVSSYTSTFSQTPYYLFSVVTSYEKSFGDHYFNVLAGYEQEEKFYSFLTATRTNLITDAVPSISTALGPISVSDTKNDWALQGIFGRLNYNFKEKYFVEFSARENGSSRFAPSSRWGFFPSGSVGYQISKENFWDGISPYVNTFKLRGSYGSLGNQNVSNYLYISSVPVVSQTPWIIGNQLPSYAGTPSLVSASLTWEKITTANIGIDAGFLHNRLNLTFDWFTRKTSDMFGPSATLPYTLGTSTPEANNATLQTRGFELILEWRDKIGADFHYNAQISLGDAHSEILSYKNEEGFIYDWYDGKKVGEIWGFKTDHILQSPNETMPDQSAIYPNWGPGDMAYNDLTNDGKITYGNSTLTDHGDLTVIGNTTPRYNIGINAGATYKGFDFNMSWMGSLQQDYYPGDYDQTFWGLVPGWGASAVLKDSPVLDYWRPADETNLLGPNTNSYLPKPYFSQETYKNRAVQSGYVLNAAYLRLKNIQLGYTLPTQLAKKIAMQKARVFISGGNLITFCGLPKSLDPEQTIAGQTNYSQNGAFYPIAKSYSIGVNLTF